MNNIRKTCVALKNSSDNNRCVACCVAGIINAFSRKKIHTKPEDLDALLYPNNAYSSTKRTWPTLASIILARHGLQVKMYVPMPMTWKDIMEKGLDNKLTQYLSKNFNTRLLQKSIVKASRLGISMYNYGLQDIEKVMKYDTNLICMTGINPHILKDIHSRKKGGHYVIVIDANADEVIISDPGLPYQKRLSLPRKKFDASWKKNPYRSGEIIIVNQQSKPYSLE